ncbi:hypothetical protein Y032_0050g2058 [Ancylostoma ceylanicum]|uniref:Uncharacterized protein n=2 Tax=Ancylostoma ceylanicum TaxID=53326 RepID=A0A016UA28_9BILA|nr:hypothetical protein Y032_0050g2058 [Ancylostoma ceylanicum]
MHSLSSVHHRMFSLLHPLIQMPPHPSYPCGYYSDHNRYHYHNHQPATARRCFPRFTPRRNDARPYPSPPPPPLISDSFFWSANMPPPLDRPVPSFAKVVASSNGSRMRPSTGPPSTSTVPPLAPPAQLPKNLLPYACSGAPPSIEPDDQPADVALQP